MSTWPPPDRPRNRRAFYLDTLERTVWTFLQAAAGAVIDVVLTGELTWRAVAYAALLAFLKAIVAVRLPWTAPDSASTLPHPVDPPTEPPG